MPNQWRTVYKSANKQVLIKPRNRIQPRSYRSRPVPTGKSPDLLRLVGGTVLIITVIMVAVEGWPYIAAILILYAIGRSRRK